MSETKNEDERLWGLKAIGDEINRNVNQTFWLIEKKEIPAVKKGGLWTITRGELRRAFQREAVQ